MSPWATIGAVLAFIVLFGSAVRAAPSMWRGVKGVAQVPDMLESLGRVAAAGDRIIERFDRLEQLELYAHDRVHELGEKITPLVGWPPLFEARLTAVEERVTALETQATDPT